jgi:hypothetical protein
MLQVSVSFLKNAKFSIVYKFTLPITYWWYFQVKINVNILGNNCKQVLKITKRPSKQRINYMWYSSWEADCRSSDQEISRHFWYQKGHYNIVKSWTLYWVSLIQCNQLHRPYIFPKHLTGDIYAGFLQNRVSAILENLPMRLRLMMYYQHYEASSPFSKNVTQYPNESVVVVRWIGHRLPRISDSYIAMYEVTWKEFFT